MSEYRYDNVRLALGEGSSMIRQSLKSALYGKGFRDVIDTAHFSRVEEVVHADACDLLVIDAELPGGDVCDFIHRLRHHKVGSNPFLLTIVLSGDPTVGMARRVLDSGSDDLVLKPISVDLLIDRIEAMVRGRKPFVVTHDYIGPDRRKQQRADAASAPLHEVPNPLRQKVLGDVDQEALQRMIDEAAMRINESKMERYSVQIAFLVDQLESYYGETEPYRDDVVPLIERLLLIAEDLSRRLRGTQFAPVSELALSLAGLANRLMLEPVKPDHIDLELLPKLAQAIARAFQIDQSEVAAAQEISQSVLSARRG